MMSDRVVSMEVPRTQRIRPTAPATVEIRGQKRDLLAAQQEDWQAGHPAPPEEYLARWPTDPKSDPDAASLIAAEYLKRRERGEPLNLGAFVENYPEHGQAVTTLVHRQEILQSLGGKKRGLDDHLRLPGLGEDLFGYRLRCPLGRGAFARVFIAEQADLAGRPVVLKVSAIEGNEPQTLARLQHTNIVPIYSVHEDARAGLRAVCMPYFGGASLSAVLERLGSSEERPSRGADLVEALEMVGSPAPEVLCRDWEEGRQSVVANREARPEAPSPLAQLRGLSYIQATAWMIAQLAEGLQHAHQRGILHRDIKPSNILLSAEGQPLLLDFNVSEDAAGDTAEAVLGGTVAYAAPEHLVALIERTPESFRRVDRRSDLYALGLVLVEMLTGQRPFDQDGSYSALPTQIEAMAVERGKGAPSARAIRPDVPWGLESIARKCLEPDPEKRYREASHLAEDLRRFLEDRPLKHAPELSRWEQAGKFFRRHPRLTTFGTVFLAATIGLLAIGSALAAVRGHLAETRTRLADARARLVENRARERKRSHDAGVLGALCLVNTMLGQDDHLRRGAALCEQTLALYDLPDDRSGAEPPDWSWLSPPERRQVAEDRRELLLLLAGARVRLKPGDDPTLQQALTLLDQAERIPGLPPSKALWLDRASYLSLLGEGDRAAEARKRAEAIPAHDARDHYLLAISHARQGGTEGYRKAIAELDAALQRNPKHYWSLLQRGICRMELGEYVLAVGDFGACTGLWPEHSWGFFNRGYVLDRSGLKTEAIADYTTAIDRDPNFTAALVNRGLARLELQIGVTRLVVGCSLGVTRLVIIGPSASGSLRKIGEQSDHVAPDSPPLPRTKVYWVRTNCVTPIQRYSAALTDFDASLALGRNDSTIHAGRGIALEALKRHAEADDAFREAFHRVAPGADRARLLWTYGFSIASRQPKKAREAFDDVLRHDPEHPQALYGRAMLAMEEDQLDVALDFFDRAIAANPEFPEARRSRAVVAARRGDWERAGGDIRWCLEREPRSGATLYAAACVAARAAEASSDPRSVDQALDLLQRAIALGDGRQARDDPDLAAIRDDPRFLRLVADTARAIGKEATDAPAGAALIPGHPAH